MNKIKSLFNWLGHPFRVRWPSGAKIETDMLPRMTGGRRTTNEA